MNVHPERHTVAIDPNSDGLGGACPEGAARPDRAGHNPEEL
jgi:hypothetical protein